jgi:pilus assembly protein CpaF
MPEPSFLSHPALAPIRTLMLDPQVSEVMINGPAQVFVERGGVMELCAVRFRDDQQVQQVIEALLRPSNRDVTVSSPYVDFRLPDGSRGNVIIPPVALNGPVVTIRKFTRHLTTAEDLVRVGTLSRPMADLLTAAVKGRANIVFSGAAGTGKTTTLAILARAIPDTERIITIEDTAELVLGQPHVVRLEGRRPNVEGKGAVTLAQLVRNALRMRPTRIIVGEVRGDEAVDMLEAITSGHQGCFAVVHGSTALDALSRLEMMVLSRGLLLPLWAVRQQIASAIDLIVQHELLADGARKITHVTEVTGLENEGILLRDLFVYERTHTDGRGHERGRWRASGVRPRFAAKCERWGVPLKPAWYSASDGKEEQ